MKKKVILYARVSVLDLNPENQLVPLRKHAESLGLDIIDEMVDYASGTKEDRPSLQQALNRLKKSDADLLMVFSIDRLARSLGHLIRIVDDLRKDSKGVMILRENLNLFQKDPQSEFTLMIFGALAQYEASLVASRTKNALAVARSKGKRLGRPSKRNPEIEKQVVTLIEQGISVREISKRLKVIGKSTVQAIARDQKIKNVTTV